MWRIYVGAVNWFGRIAGDWFGAALIVGWRAWIGARLLRAGYVSAYILLAVCPLVTAQPVKPQEFERLRMQVEAQQDRVNRIDSSLDSVKLDVAAIQLDMAANLGAIKSDVNAMKWIGSLFGTILLACLPFAFKAGRWYQKTEHISGNHTPIR